MQVAPAVRAAWGETFGLSPEVATEKRMALPCAASALTMYLTPTLTADLTIMEEGTEFLGRLQHPGDHKWPMFTSCCPGWVRFLKSQYPDMVDQLSTAKIPPADVRRGDQELLRQRRSAWIPRISSACPSCPAPPRRRSWPSPISTMRPRAQGCGFLLTTREFCQMIRADQIDVTALEY